MVSCEAPFDPDLFEEEPRLVVVSSFSPNKPIEVYLSLSQSVTSQAQPEYIAQAEVDVFEGETLLERLELASKTDGQVVTPYFTHPHLIPEEGVIYTVRVRVPGFAPVTASSSIPRPVSLEDIQVKNLEFTQEEENRLYTYDLGVRFRDPGGEKNYYHLNVFQQLKALHPGPSGEPAATPYKVLFPSELNTNYVVANHDGGILLEDTPFEGSYADLSFPVQLTLNQNREKLGALYIELRSVSREYFLFHSSISKQREQGANPLQEPVLVFNNIENGHGIFAGYNISKDSLDIGN